MKRKIFVPMKKFRGMYLNELKLKKSHNKQTNKQTKNNNNENNKNHNETSPSPFSKGRHPSHSTKMSSKGGDTLPCHEAAGANTGST